MFTRYWGCIEIKVCGFAHVWLLPNTWSCIIVLIVCKMFVVSQNLNTDLPKRFKCLIYDKFDTIRAVLLLFQICAADVLIFEPLSWLCGTNRTLLSEQHKYHDEFTRHWGCIEIKVCGFAHVWLLPNIYLRPCIIVLIVFNMFLSCPIWTLISQNVLRGRFNCLGSDHLRAILLLFQFCAGYVKFELFCWLCGTSRTLLKSAT